MYAGVRQAVVITCTKDFTFYFYDKLASKQIVSEFTAAPCSSSGPLALLQCQSRCLDFNMARQTHGPCMCNGAKCMLECTRNLSVVGEMNLTPCTVKGKQCCR